MPQKIVRPAISGGGQAARSGVAGALSAIVYKLAVAWEPTTHIANEISLVTFFTLTQLGMFARNVLKSKLLQWLG